MFCFSTVNDARFLTVLIQLTKSFPNPNFWRICNKKQWLTKSNACASVLATSKISEITLQLSLINLFLKYAVWLEEIRKGNTFFILVERTLLIKG